MTIYNDREAQPDERVGELCLNCGKDWPYHYGWACLKFVNAIVGISTNKNSVSSTKRYLTKDMFPPNTSTCAANIPDDRPTAPGWLRALGTFPHWAPKKEKANLSDWKTWRDQGRTLDECACGIPRSQCSYHKD